MFTFVAETRRFCVTLSQHIPQTMLIQRVINNEQNESQLCCFRLKQTVVVIFTDLYLSLSRAPLCIL